ncbi:hypothetical protein [Aliivibrio fischeri]|uniref:hypothetical protein n=1 Tax=Aliivibrio fischeri TaxID=668 RepID=UPI00084BD7B8|nr:hypothetical protein [Aliivibrio fischeri]OED52906.1 hypothetical protein BEI47_18670 [Aliivibrio fischeri]
MDTSDLIIDHSEADFADAIRNLLPQGDYWLEADNTELTNTILGMAADFKVTSDEIQLALLTDFNESLFGWKLSDYQALLISSGGQGVVSDTRNKPNLIYVSLASNERCEKAWFEFEKVRLPHTEIQWIYNSTINVHTQVANARHTRTLYQHEVTQ